MILTAKGKFIDTKPMERLLTQGEKYADKIHFVLPAINNDVNIVNCAFAIRTVASDGSMTETGLTAQRSIEQVLLTWDVPESVTAVAGMLQMELVGIKDSDIIIKYKMPAIFIKGAVMGDHLPPPDIIEEKLAQMNGILAQAQAKLDEAKDMVVNISSDIIDKTLTISDKAADAKATGDRLEGLNDDITELDKLVKGILTNISSGGIAQSMIEVINARTSPGLKGQVFESLSDRLKEEFSEKVDFGAFWANMDDISQQFIVDEKEVKDARISPGLDNREFNSLSERLESEFSATQTDINSLKATARKLDIVETSIGMIKSKNLLKNTAGTTTQNGITFTYNDDGSVTCNGTATADTNYIYTVTLPQNSSFILSGCPTGGSKSTYSLFARDTATWSIVYFDTGSSRTVKTGNYTTWQVVIRISNGQTVNDMTFYPMLRNADIYADDAEYEPYSDDLQTQINDLNADSGWIRATTNSSGGEAWYRKCGKTVEFRCAVVLLDSGITEWDFCTLPEGCRPSAKIVTGVATVSQNDNLYKMQISKSGVVTIFTSNETGLPIRSTYMIHACFLTD